MFTEEGQMRDEKVGKRPAPRVGVTSRGTIRWPLVLVVVPRAGYDRCQSSATIRRKRDCGCNGSDVPKE